MHLLVSGLRRIKKMRGTTIKICLSFLCFFFTDILPTSLVKDTWIINDAVRNYVIGNGKPRYVGLSNHGNERLQIAGAGTVSRHGRVTGWLGIMIILGQPKEGDPQVRVLGYVLTTLRRKNLRLNKTFGKASDLD